MSSRLPPRPVPEIRSYLIRDLERLTDQAVMPLTGLLAGEMYNALAQGKSPQQADRAFQAEMDRLAEQRPDLRSRINLVTNNALEWERAGRQSAAESARHQREAERQNAIFERQQARINDGTALARDPDQKPAREEVQSLLVRAGVMAEKLPNGKPSVDGDFGNTTATAVTAFRQRTGSTQTGAFRPSELTRLQAFAAQAEKQRYDASPEGQAAAAARQRQAETDQTNHDILRNAAAAGVGTMRRGANGGPELQLDMSPRAATPSETGNIFSRLFGGGSTPATTAPAPSPAAAPAPVAAAPAPAARVAPAAPNPALEQFLSNGMPSNVRDIVARMPDNLRNSLAEVSAASRSGVFSVRQANPQALAAIGTLIGADPSQVQTRINEILKGDGRRENGQIELGLLVSHMVTSGRVDILPPVGTPADQRPAGTPQRSQ